MRLADQRTLSMVDRHGTDKGMRSCWAPVQCSPFAPVTDCTVTLPTETPGSCSHAHP